MKLLVFAHRAEAQSFFSGQKFKSHQLMNELYIGEKFHILLVGEGIYSTLSKLSKALTLLPNIVDIVNLGICGSFEKTREKYEIVEVDIVYAQDEFKSYPLSTSSKNTISCITSKDRILTLEQGEHLKNMAAIVDRELWAIAFVCKENLRKLSSIKIISDHISDAEVCELIKEEAEVFSDLLYKYYIGQTSVVIDSKLERISLLDEKAFYFTLNQERNLISICDIIKKQLPNLSEASIFDRAKIGDIKKIDISAKARTKLLLDNLQIIAYPLKHKIKVALDDILTQYKKLNITLRFDETLEKEGFDLNISITDQNHLNTIIKSLEIFPWSKLKYIQSGDIFKDLND